MPHSLQDLRSLTRDGAGAHMPHAQWHLNHWTTKEVPPIAGLFIVLISILLCQGKGRPKEREVDGGDGQSVGQAEHSTLMGEVHHLKRVWFVAPKQ